MGYWANSIEGSITIPNDKKDDALAEIVKVFERHNSSTGADWDRYEIPTNLEDALAENNFEFTQVDEGLNIYSWEGKWRLELERLIDAVLKVATPESSLAFRGEDGEMWRHTPSGTQNATIVWQ